MNDNNSPVPGVQSLPWRAMLVLGIIVILVRVSLFPFIFPYKNNPQGALITDNWGVIARNLAEGHGYTLPYHGNPDDKTPTPTAFREPVPVLWIAGIFTLFGFKLWPVLIGNWLLDAATAMILYLLARYIFPRQSAFPILSVLMFAFYVPEMWTSYMAISESIFTLLLMLHLLTLVHLLDRPSMGRAAWSGMWLGLASLARPIMLAFPAIILVLMVLRYHRVWQTVKHLAMLGLVFVIVLSPWVIRNYLSFGAFVPSSTLLGYNLIKNNYYLTSDDYLRQLFPPERVKVEMERLLNARGDSLADYNQAAQDKVYVREALARVAQRPDRFLALSANRFLYLWFYFDFVERQYTQSLPVALSFAALHVALLASLALSLVSELRTRSVQALPLWVTILYFTLFYSLIHAQPRYLVPVMPLVMLLAAPAVYNGLTKLFELTLGTLGFSKEIAWFGRSGNE